MSHFRNRLYFRQAIRVMGLAFALGLFFSGVQIAIDFENERASVHDTVSQFLETLREPATQAAFTMNRSLALGVVESLLKYQPIYSASIFTELGDSLASRSHAPAPSRFSWFAEKLLDSGGEYTVILASTEWKGAVGKVVISVDASLIADNFLRRAGLTLIFGFLRNIVFALAVMVVFYFTLSRPINRLSKALGAADGLNTQTSLSLDPADYGDSEMGRLLAAANRFLEHQVTIRTKALRQQNAALKRLTAAVENSPVAVVMTDDAGRIIYVNPRFESMTGYHAVEITKKHISSAQNLSQQAQEEISRQSARGGVWRGEFEGQHKDGSCYWLEVAVATIHGEGGRVGSGRDSYQVWVQEDVTERKHAEQALREAKQTAENATRAKSEFLANMSHELRTPLNAVLGYTQVLQREPGLSQKQAHGLHTILRSGEHLLLLINDALDLSKIESGKFELYPTDVNFTLFVNLIGDIIRIKAEEKGVSFMIETDVNLPCTIQADEKRLRQVLLNLLGNAVKFTDHGEVGLRLGFLGYSGTQVMIAFEVRDTGVGMQEEEVASLFRPYEQVGTLQRRIGGTGLGLVISQHLVRLMGGNIAVESKTGIGSVFRFELTVPTSLGSVPAPSDEPMAVGYQGPRRRILVIDENASHRAMLLNLLGGVGFIAQEGDAGEPGLNNKRAEEDGQADSLAPELIVANVTTPVQAGIDMILRIRQVPQLRDVPMIAVSGIIGPGEQSALREAGANVLLLKPLDANGLFRHMGEYLHLAWIYRGQQGAPGTDEKAGLVAPPQKELRTLYRLALAGNMRDIRQHAAHIMSLDARYKGFAVKLQTLTEDYESRAILDLAKQYMD